MSNDGFLNILIAEDNDVSRNMMASILQAKGYRTFDATDGDNAIEVIKDKTIHLALVDVNMAPTGGFEFVKHLLAKKIDIPVVIITADESADMLMEATSLGVAHVIQKPIDADRLLKTVHRIISRRGLNPSPLAVQEHSTRYDPEELMQKTIALASSNVKASKGGPYAAVVTDQDGQILGTGTNRHSGRVDPIAHAEVMAIQAAAQKLGQADLSQCVLYCSSQPTKIGEALIESVGIAQVYFALKHEDMSAPLKKTEPVEYQQLCHDEAVNALKSFL